MSNSTLPSRPSLEYLRKLAKDRLAVLRQTDPGAQLAAALLAVAQDHGFSSWRALKAEIDRRRATNTSRWFDALQKKDVETVRALLHDDPTLIAARGPRHNASALHFAAGCGDLETVRVLVDAGADPNDEGDDERVGVIGWATFIANQEVVPMDVVSLLIDRGARHHIFSAIAAGNLTAIRTLVEQHPEALDRRLSSVYHGQTALHFTITRGRLDILDLLIELGADLEATDQNGQTALEFAKLRGDRAAADRLLAAGAREPKQPPAPDLRAAGDDLAPSIEAATFVVGTRDVASTLDWYESIGFTEVGRFPAEGPAVFWGMVALGKAELTFDVREGADPRGVSLLLVTNRVRDFYESMKARQLSAADVEFVKTLHEPEHGGIEFSIRDPNGLTLRFLQEERR
jgi:hypothetical protein